MRFLKILSSACLIASIASCGNQSSSEVQSMNSDETEVTNVKTDLQELGLKGNVKVIKQEEFYKGNSETEIGLKTGLNSFSYKFNETGYKTEEQYYDSIGMIKDKSEYLYSADGKKTGKRIKDLNNKILHSYRYEYDEYGRIIKIDITDFEGNDKFDYYTTSEYDENGNEILSITYTPDGKRFQSAKYEYENDRKIKLTLLDNMDSPYAICEYKYNEKGDINRELFYTGNGLLFEEYSMEYTYDTQNNWIKKTYFLEKKHMNSSGNADRKLGVQTITMRTITYK